MTPEHASAEDGALGASSGVLLRWPPVTSVCSALFAHDQKGLALFWLWSGVLARARSRALVLALFVQAQHVRMLRTFSARRLVSD
eukprot:15436824-Alexandrium_andersonii.AAC.1